MKEIKKDKKEMLSLFKFDFTELFYSSFGVFNVRIIEIENIFATFSLFLPIFLHAERLQEGKICLEHFPFQYFQIVSTSDFFLLSLLNGFFV